MHKHEHTLTARHVFPLCHVIQHLPICFPHVAHGLIRDLFRGSENLIRGPPGPPGIPGIPGQKLWVSSRDNVVDMVDYIKCKFILVLLTQYIGSARKELLNYGLCKLSSVKIILSK